MGLNPVADSSEPGTIADMVLPEMLIEPPGRGVVTPPAPKFTMLPAPFGCNSTTSLKRTPSMPLATKPGFVVPAPVFTPQTYSPPGVVDPGVAFIVAVKRYKLVEES